MTGREIVYRSLTQIEENGGFSNLVLKDWLEKADVRDKGLITALVYGVIQERLFLDYQIERFCDLKKTSSALLRLLRMGTYQIYRMDRIPVSAAVNETVRVAKKIAPRGAGFCNAVLRSISACDAVLPPEWETDDYFSIRYSMPLWLVRKWKKQFGEEMLESLLSGLSSPSRTYIRVNKNSAEQIQKEIPGLTPSFFPDGFFLPGGVSVESLPAWKEGRISVMQPSSMAVCKSSGVKPGMKVCDMCAAPGGKTMYLAQLMNDQGEIVAWELHPHRTELLNKNLERMGIRSVKTECRDSCVYDVRYRNYFDVVILDAPCSGLGMIGGKPELKWQNPDRIKGLLPIQEQLLKNAGEYVAPNGILLYSTCTLNKAENETMIQRFLSANPDFQTDLKDGMRNLLPHRDGMGGFFIAKLRKITEETDG